MALKNSNITFFSSRVFIGFKNIFHLPAYMEKAMAPHSSTLALKIPWMVEPGGAVHGVAKSWTWLSDFTFMHWRRKWQPTPVFLPGESQGQESLVGCHLWGHRESDTTEATSQQQQLTFPIFKIHYKYW